MEMVQQRNMLRANTRVLELHPETGAYFHQRGMQMPAKPVQMALCCWSIQIQHARTDCRQLLNQSEDRSIYFDTSEQLGVYAHVHVGHPIFFLTTLV